MKELIKSDRFIKIIIIFSASVFILLFMGSTVKNLSGGKNDSLSDNELEKRVTLMIESLEGVKSDIKPMVTIRLAKDNLTVLGVAVICKDSDNPVIREKIIDMLSKLLDINISKISITY